MLIKFRIHKAKNALVIKINLYNANLIEKSTNFTHATIYYYDRKWYKLCKINYVRVNGIVIQNKHDFV